MRVPPRLSGISALLLVGAFGLAPVADAAVTDCTYTKSKKLVTLRIDNSATTGSLVIERGSGSNKIGYRAGGDPWTSCGGRTTDTDKVKVVGSSLSEDLTIDLTNGAFVPGASNEKQGIDEIEFALDLGSGTDSVTLVGGRGRDRLAFESSTRAALNGDRDADITMSGVDQFALEGGEGNDVLDGSGVSGVSSYGDAGDDRLLGGAGRDKLYGDDWDDSTPDGNDTLVGGAGDDALYGVGGADRLIGGSEDDTLRGGLGRDEMSGGAGGDGFYAEDRKDGSDVVDGGPGTDSASYESRTTNLRLSLDRDADDGARRERDLLQPDVERLFGGSGSDVLVGNNAENYLYGGDGDDRLKGLGGNDSFNDGLGDDEVLGGSGDEYVTNQAGDDRYDLGAGDDTIENRDTDGGGDVLIGGPGRDQVSYAERSTPVFVDVADGANDGAAGENDKVSADFEVIVGGSSDDEIWGSGRSEGIYGGNGADLLNGRGGSDYLSGGEGSDQLTGGEGYDEHHGGGGNDTYFAQDEGEDYISCGSGADTVATFDGYDQIDCG